MNVSAVIVTRGDVDLSEILDSLPRDWEHVVWDNSVRDNLSVYGRYAAIAECEHDLVYVQDDDCVLDPEAFDMLLDAYQPGHVVCNMPERFRTYYPDSALVGFGALFDRRLVEPVFARALGETGYFTRLLNPLFLRTCDVVFTALTPRVLVDAPYRDLPWATGPDRMYRRPEHVGERTRMLELTRAVRDGVTA